MTLPRPSHSHRDAQPESGDRVLIAQCGLSKTARIGQNLNLLVRDKPVPLQVRDDSFRLVDENLIAQPVLLDLDELRR